MLLLHISDIHFRCDEICTPLDPNKHLRNEIVRDAEMMCDRLKKSPSAILISGDIAFAAHPDEYKFALTWLENLAVRCGATSDCIFVVPGNHDVVRNKASKMLVQALHKQIKSTESILIDKTIRDILSDQETSRIMYEPLDQFNLFALQFLCDINAPTRTITFRDLRLNDGSILRLAGLNSALVSSSADKAGDLFVDPACFQLSRERGVEHLVICHHPFSWLRHGDSLKSHLNDVARIQLFGHEHTQRIELERKTVRIAASAAHPNRAEHGWEPGYNLIELDVTGSGHERTLNVAAHVRIWQSNPGQFRPKMDGQDDVFKHAIKLEAWAPMPTEKSSGATALTDSSTAEDNVVISAAQATGSDTMDTLRSIGVRFFKLTLSQKSAIAGKLGLLEEEDINQPDFERFRRVFERARDRNMVAELAAEVNAV